MRSCPGGRTVGRPAGVQGAAGPAVAVPRAAHASVAVAACCAAGPAVSVAPALTGCPSAAGSQG